MRLWGLKLSNTNRKKRKTACVDSLRENQSPRRKILKARNPWFRIRSVFFAKSMVRSENVSRIVDGFRVSCESTTYSVRIEGRLGSGLKKVFEFLYGSAEGGRPAKGRGKLKLSPLDI